MQKKKRSKDDDQSKFEEKTHQQNQALLLATWQLRTSKRVEVNLCRSYSSSSEQRIYY